MPRVVEVFDHSTERGYSMTYEYEVLGNYGNDWEVVTIEDTVKDAVEMLACYRENDPKNPYRARRVRVNATIGR